MSAIEKSNLLEHSLPARRTPWRDFWVKLSRKKPAQLGGLIVLLLTVCTIIGPYITPYDPFEIDVVNRLEPPSTQHWFGTDEQGRDLLSRIIYGSRYTVLIGIITVSIAATGGILIGLPSGFFGGWVDTLVMRIMDIMLSFPYVLLTLAIVAMIGPSLINAMIAIGIASLPSYARLVRGSVLSTREQEYVLASRTVGATNWRLMFKTIFPNILSPLIIYISLSLPTAVLAASALSFLGLGAQPPLPEWGAMMVNSRTFLVTASWVVMAPGLAIFVTILGFNLLGNALRDVLDPRSS